MPPQKRPADAGRTGLAQLLVVLAGIACGGLLLLAASWPDDHSRRVLAWFPDASRSQALGAIAALGGRPLVSRFEDRLWLLELPEPAARGRLRAAGAWLVLDGSRFAGCVPATAPRLRQQGSRT